MRFPYPPPSGLLGPGSADPQREAVVGGVPRQRRAETRLKPAAAKLFPYRGVPRLKYGCEQRPYAAILVVFSLGAPNKPPRSTEECPVPLQLGLGERLLSAAGGVRQPFSEGCCRRVTQPLRDVLF